MRFIFRLLCIMHCFIFGGSHGIVHCLQFVKFAFIHGRGILHILVCRTLATLRYVYRSLHSVAVLFLPDRERVVTKASHQLLLSL
jgi:hypothetical protein